MFKLVKYTWYKNISFKNWDSVVWSGLEHIRHIMEQKSVQTWRETFHTLKSIRSIKPTEDKNLIINYHSFYPWPRTLERSYYLPNLGYWIIAFYSTQNLLIWINRINIWNNKSLVLFNSDMKCNSSEIRIFIMIIINYVCGLG